jgi:hypothetical protein
MAFCLTVCIYAPSIVFYYPLHSNDSLHFSTCSTSMCSPTQVLAVRYRLFLATAQLRLWILRGIS